MNRASLGRRQLLGGAVATLGASACRPAVSPGRGEAGRARIVVVGAGLAGLAAARELASQGHDVTVLEAQNRPGGRILTIREPLAEGLHVEAGAKHVIADPDLMALLAAVGVETEKARRPTPLARVSYARGARAVLTADLGPDDEDADLSEEERRLGFRDRVQRYLPPDAIHGSDWLRPELAEYDRMSVAAFLTRQGASPGYIRAAGRGIVPGELETTSALSLLREAASIVREIGLGAAARVVGGTDRLPRAIAKALGDRVVYEAEVRRLEHKADRVRVLFTRAGRFETIDADRVVVAIPYPVLRHVEITPALSPRKAKAIRELRVVSVSRLWLQASKRFWSDRGESGDAGSDLLVGDLRDETHALPGPRGVLSGYLTNAKARELCAKSPPDRVAAVLSDVEKIHPGMGEHLSVAIVKCWDEEPFARGAYAWFSVGQLTDFGTALYAPEGRLHFAGDHTSNRPGFMHGAVESAKRVVAEVQATLTRPA